MSKRMDNDDEYFSGKLSEFALTSKKQLKCSKKLYDFLITSKTTDLEFEFLQEENFLKNPTFLNNLIILLGCELPCLVSVSDYGLGIISDYDLYFHFSVSDTSIIERQFCLHLNETQKSMLRRQQVKLSNFLLLQSQFLIKSWELPMNREEINSMEVDRTIQNQDKLQWKSPNQRHEEALIALHTAVDEIIENAVSTQNFGSSVNSETSVYSEVSLNTNVKKITQSEVIDPESDYLSLGCSLEFIHSFIDQHGGRNQFNTLTTGEVCKNYIQGQSFLQNNSNTLSYCQYLTTIYPDDENTVGKANYFISHAWSYSFLELIDTLEFFLEMSDSENQISSGTKVKVWIDIFSIPQPSIPVPLTSDWLSLLFKSVMCSIGRVVAVFLGNHHHNNTTFLSRHFPLGYYISLQRIWCLYELYSAVHLNIPLEIVVSKQEFFSTIQVLSENHLHHVYYSSSTICSIKNSQATISTDKDCIVELIENTIGCEHLEYFLTERLIFAKIQFCLKAYGKFKIFQIYEQDSLRDQQERSQDLVTIDNRLKLPVFYRNLAYLYFSLNQFEDAAKYWELSFSLHFELSTLRSLLDIYFFTNQTEKLLNLLEIHGDIFQGHIIGNLSNIRQSITPSLPSTMESRTEMNRMKRMNREITEYERDFFVYLREGIISIELINDSKTELEAIITGTEYTPYVNGLFTLNIRIPDDYPFKPLIIRFNTPIFHCNISRVGEISLDILGDQWGPSLTIAKILISIRSLLDDPNPHEGFNINSCYLFKTNPSKYHQIAREWTEKYAIRRKMIDNSQIVDI